MKTKSSTLARGLLAMALAGTTASAAAFEADRYIGGDWGGGRAKLAEAGIEFKLGHFSQTAHNTSGGQRSRVAYADQFFLGGYFDLGKLWGWQGAEFKLEITNRNGELINDVAGVPFLLQSQQIFGRGNVTRLTQFSVTQHLLDYRLSIKAGRIYPSADFFAMSCAFQHLTFCSGGSSNFISSRWFGDPLSAWGGQVTFRPRKRLHLKLGGYDTNPGALSKRQGLKLGTSGDSGGTLVVAEIEYRPDYGNDLDGAYRLGVVRNSSDLPKVFDTAGLPAETGGNSVQLQDSERAFYVNLEQQITHNDFGGGWRLFASLIRADQNVNQVAEVAAIGAYLDAPFPSRPRDRLGLAVGRNAVSDKLKRAQRLHNRVLSAGSAPIGVQSYEYPIEVNYSIAVANGIAVMPSLQHVRRPAGLDVSGATIVGLQIGLDF
jgi:porin